MRAKIEQDVRKFIHDSFLFREDRAELDANESLLDAGLIDSTGILELVGFLESHFGIQVADAEMIPDNLDSVGTIVAYVDDKLARARAAA
jgi:acyl carrier protein